MPEITKQLAADIIRKLQRIPKNPPHVPLVVEAVSGANHDIYKFSYRGVWIGQFGIMRGSKKDARHNWIAEQLHLKKKQALDLARCPMSIDQFIDYLQEIGQIPADSPDTDLPPAESSE